MKLTLKRAGCVFMVLLTHGRPLPVAEQAPPAGGILIRGGLVVDGSGAAPREADVRIQGDSIIAIAAGLVPRASDRIIEARGMIVAPGFIDLHSHADKGIEDWPEAESQIRQGITLAVVGQDGRSALPVASFLETIQQTRPTINFATMIGHGAVRAAVLGRDFRQHASADEVSLMARLVERGMRDGAVGLSSGLEYDPGFYADSNEVASLASIVSRFGGFYATHVRDEEDGVIAAWREAVDVGRRTGVRVNISHAKLASKAVWGKTAEALAVLDAGRRDGVQVTADWYPYDYWQSSLYVLAPTRDWANPAVWSTGLADIGGPANVMVTSYPPRPEYVGRTLQDIATERGIDAVGVIREMMDHYGPNVGIIATAMDERDLDRFVVDPHVMICSDGQLRGKHPRGYGAFPRVVANYVRKKGLLSLSDAIAKMTARPADVLQFADRGRLRVGNRADVVVFDQSTVEDRGTKLAPSQYPAGIEYVVVNGELVLDHGRLTDARPGRALRRALPDAGLAPKRSE